LKLAETKLNRSSKKQLGQFMTPPHLVKEVLNTLNFQRTDRILEPSFGTGNFLIEIISRLLHGQYTRENFNRIMTEQLFGCELDPLLYRAAIDKIEKQFWPLPKKHNLHNSDYFTTSFSEAKFDKIIGNPPFGGSFDPSIEDSLDSQYGRRNGHKIKKETYSFFTVRSLDLLTDNGSLHFLLSDTFLTISTMSGLRYELASRTNVTISHIDHFSDETSQPIVLLTAVASKKPSTICIDGHNFQPDELKNIGKFSWGTNTEFIEYFNGPLLSEYIVCTSGMTTGNNQLFVRRIVDNTISEPYDFTYFEEPITLKGEIERARLGHLSNKQQKIIIDQEARGETRRNLLASKLSYPKTITLPHPDYRYYNKASNGVFFTNPTHAIFWKDEGEAVLTYKKNGKWYLRGVGGAKFFGHEGITWQLIAPEIRMRFLPEGYILDSGAPCGFLRSGIDPIELWIILAWCNSSLASRILKKAINHTRNIQSKDIERLPYPWWVPADKRMEAAEYAKSLVTALQHGQSLPAHWKERIDSFFGH
jgi:DNA binding domain protein, excisionase family